jgi:hypothetical protein
MKIFISMLFGFCLSVFSIKVLNFIPFSLEWWCFILPCIIIFEMFKCLVICELED